MVIFRCIFLRKRHILEKKVIEKIEKKNICSKIFFFENRSVAEKYNRDGKATGDTMSHAHCVLDK